MKVNADHQLQRHNKIGYQVHRAKTEKGIRQIPMTPEAAEYNSIYNVQMPKVTPHVCRHTFCSRMAAARMNPKIMQYIMGHSDISVTLDTYTHPGFEEASEEIRRLAASDR